MKPVSQKFKKILGILFIINFIVWVIAMFILWRVRTAQAPALTNDQVQTTIIPTAISINQAKEIRSNTVFTAKKGDIVIIDTQLKLVFEEVRVGICPKEIICSPTDYLLVEISGTENNVVSQIELGAGQTMKPDVVDQGKIGDYTIKISTQIADRPDSWKDAIICKESECSVSFIVTK